MVIEEKKGEKKGKKGNVPRVHSTVVVKQRKQERNQNEAYYTVDPSQTMNGLFECTLPHHHLLFPSLLPLLFPSTLLSVVRPNLESSRIASFHSTLPVLLLTFPTFYSYSSLLLSSPPISFTFVRRVGNMFSHRDRSSTVFDEFFFLFFLPKKKRKRKRKKTSPQKSFASHPLFTDNSYLTSHPAYCSLVVRSWKI